MTSFNIALVEQGLGRLVVDTARTSLDRRTYGGEVDKAREVAGGVLCVAGPTRLAELIEERLDAHGDVDAALDAYEDVIADALEQYVIDGVRAAGHTGSEEQILEEAADMDGLLNATRARPAFLGYSRERQAVVLAHGEVKLGEVKVKVSTVGTFIASEIEPAMAAVKRLGRPPSDLATQVAALRAQRMETVRRYRERDGFQSADAFKGDIIAWTVTPESITREHAGPVWPSTKPRVRSGPKVGRNEPCPCGSGKKYKKCCIRAAA